MASQLFGDVCRGSGALLAGVVGRAMAIINCPECQRQVSTTAATCPGCGAPVPVAPPVAEPGPPPDSYAPHKKSAVLMVGVGLASLAFGLMDTHIWAVMLGLLLIGGGIVWSISAKVRSWWKP